MSTTTQERGRIEGFRIGLRWARAAKGWTQKETAFSVTEHAKRLTGNPEARVSVSLIAMIEAGEREPSYEVAEWIAGTFEREITDFAIVREVAA